MIHPGESWKRPRVLGFALVAFSVLLYLDTVRNPLLLDSRPVVLEDPSIRSLRNIPSFFLQPSLPRPEFEGGGEGRLAYYRPVTKAMLALEHSLFGEHPTGYHVVNVVLNALVVLLFFRLVLEVSGRSDLAIASSFLFAANPGRSEAVYWVYGISDILMALGVLAALLLYHRRRYVPAALVFLGSLFCRETAVVFPLVLLLFEWLLRRAESARRFLRPLPFMLPVAVYLLARNAAVGGAPPLTDLPPFTLFNTAVVIIKRFLKIMVVPDAMVAHYPLEVFPRVTGEVLVSYGLAAALAGALALFLKRDRALAFWLLFGLSWLAIWLNVGQFGHYLLTEKALYLAAGGFAVMLAGLLLRLRHAPVLLAVIVVAQAGIVVVRGTYWRTPETYLEAALRFSPDSPMLRTELAGAYHERGDTRAAMAELRAVLSIAPGFTPARYTLGMLHVHGQEYRLAASQFEKVIRELPDHTWALNGLGNCYVLLGETHRAIPLWSRALEADPRNAEASYNLGMVAESKGDRRGALRYYRHYLEHAEVPAPRVAEHVRQLEEALNAENR